MGMLIAPVEITWPKGYFYLPTSTGISMTRATIKRERKWLIRWNWRLQIVIQNTPHQHPLPIKHTHSYSTHAISSSTYYTTPHLTCYCTVRDTLHPYRPTSWASDPQHLLHTPRQAMWCLSVIQVWLIPCTRMESTLCHEKFCLHFACTIHSFIFSLVRFVVNLEPGNTSCLGQGIITMNTHTSTYKASLSSPIHLVDITCFFVRSEEI